MLSSTKALIAAGIMTITLRWAMTYLTPHQPMDEAAKSRLKKLVISISVNTFVIIFWFWLVPTAGPDRVESP